MMKVTVRWKDTSGHPCPPASYRKVTISRYNDGKIRGWTLGIAGNTNIYASQECAKNAIDEILGGTARRHVESRLKKGIKIVGTTNE